MAITPENDDTLNIDKLQEKEAGKGITIQPGVNKLKSVTGINSIVASLDTAITGYETGAVFLLEPANDITGATTINIDGEGVTAVVSQAGAALVGGEMLATGAYHLMYDGSSFVLMNPEPAVATSSFDEVFTDAISEKTASNGILIKNCVTLLEGVNILTITGGTSAAITATTTPALTAYNHGASFYLITGVANGGLSGVTINIDGLGVKSIKDDYGQDLIVNQIQPNIWYLITYDVTNDQFIIANPSHGFQDYTSSATTSWNGSPGVLLSPVVNRAVFYALGGRFIRYTGQADGDVSSGFEEYLISLPHAASVSSTKLWIGTALIRPDASSGSHILGRSIISTVDSSYVRVSKVDGATWTTGSDRSVFWDITYERS